MCIHICEFIYVHSYMCVHMCAFICVHAYVNQFITSWYDTRAPGVNKLSPPTRKGEKVPSRNLLTTSLTSGTDQFRIIVQYRDFCSFLPLSSYDFCSFLPLSSYDFCSFLLFSADPEYCFFAFSFYRGDDLAPNTNSYHPFDHRRRSLFVGFFPYTVHGFFYVRLV